MLTFAVIVGRRGAPVTEEVRARLAALEAMLGPEAVDRGVLLRDDDVLRRWEDPEGRVVVVGWEPAVQPLGTGSRWWADPDGLTAFTGLPRMPGCGWSASEPWAAQLSRHARRNGSAALRDLHGVHATVHLDASGHGVVTPDPMGFDLLYRAETPDAVIISTRAALAAWMSTPAGAWPALDLEHASALAFGGFPLDDRTGFEAVRCLPAGGWCRLTDDGLEVQTPSRSHWYRPGPVDLDARVDELEDLIGSALRFAAELPTPPPVLELTGGMDSRLLLAVAVRAGLAEEFSYMTWGPPELPDVRIADAVLSELGLGRRGRDRPEHPLPATGSLGDPVHDRDGIDGIEADHRRRFQRHLLATSGCTSSWHQRPTELAISPRASVCGIETMRATRARLSWFTTRQQVEAYVRLGGFNTDPAGVLRPEVRRHHQDQLLRSLFTDLIPGERPQDIFDLHDITVRLRRWFGSFNELETRNRVYPLQGVPQVQTAFALGPELRRASVVHFDLMGRTAPRLAEMPFADGGWPADLAEVRDTSRVPLAGPPGPDRPLRVAVRTVAAAQRLRLPEPARRRVADAFRAMADRRDGAGSHGSSVVQVRHAAGGEARLAVLREQFERGGDHPLHDRIDLSAARAKLDRYADLTDVERRGLHDAATALAWTAPHRR